MKKSLRYSGTLQGELRHGGTGESLETDTDAGRRDTYGPPDVVAGGVLHGHLAHLLHLLAGAAPREQRQVVAPHLRVVTVVLQRARQRVQRCVQTLRHGAANTEVISDERRHISSHQES